MSKKPTDRPADLLSAADIAEIRAELQTVTVQPYRHTFQPTRPTATLSELVGLIRGADDDMLRFDVDLTELGLRLRETVDETVAYIDYCRERAATLGARAKQLAEKAAEFDARAKAAEAEAAHVMFEDAQHHGVDVEAARGEDRFRYSGDDLEIELYLSESCKPLQQPDARLYRFFGPKLIKREYSWRLNELKALVAKGHPAAKRWAEIVKKPYVKIKPKI